MTTTPPAAEFKAAHLLDTFERITDQIFVQAKRYKPENVIDRQTIQAFIGALTGQRVTKGIFITTSSFNL